MNQLIGDLTDVASIDAGKLAIARAESQPGAGAKIVLTLPAHSPLPAS